MTSGPGAAERQERRRLAADVTELHVAATHLPFDTCNLPLRVNTVRALETRLAYMLPLISTLEDRLSQLGPRDGASSRLLSDVVAWAKDEDAGEAEVLRERCRRLTPVIDSDSGWDA